MGYVAPGRTRSTSRTPTPRAWSTRPTRCPAPLPCRRAAVDDDGQLQFTETNAYSGNNGRAAILQRRRRERHLHGRQRRQRRQPAARRGDRSAPARRSSPHHAPEARSSPGAPTPVGSFNITQLGDKADKIGKDDNFRGLTIYNNVALLHQGQRRQRRQHRLLHRHDRHRPARTAVGLPAAGAPLPTAPLSYDPATLQTTRRCPATCASCKGFPTTLAKTDDERVPVRHVVRQRRHAVRRRRGQRRQHLHAGDRHLHRGGRADHGRACRSGSSTATGVEARLHAQAGLDLGTPYTVPATRPATTRRPACRGRRPPTGCATSPAGSTRTARPRSGPSPRP